MRKVETGDVYWWGEYGWGLTLVVFGRIKEKHYLISLTNSSSYEDPGYIASNTLYQGDKIQKMVNEGRLEFKFNLKELETGE